MAFFKKTEQKAQKEKSEKKVNEKTDGNNEVKEEKNAPKKKVEAEKVAVIPKLSADRNLASVIKKPRITEKAALLLDRNVYTFEIRKDATKHDVRDAIKEQYDVTPISVNIVSSKPRHYMSKMRGRKMMEKGLKKAYVELKEGDRIDLA